MSNLSDIGFDVEDDEALNNLLYKVYPYGKKIPVVNGAYILYADPSGAELWIQVDNDNHLLNFNPHFNGRTKRKVFITAPVNRSYSVLDGAYHAWADPTDEGNPESGTYPFVFELPDAKTVNIPSLPVIKQIQLTAFAHGISVYTDEKEYNAAQTTELKFASQSFIPSSLFADTGNGHDTTSDCMFAGFIKDFELLENDFTKQKFYWLRVDTLGGEVDVVADLKYFEKEPVLNGIVHGNFWLSARIMKDYNKPVKKNLFQRLFGK